MSTLSAAGRTVAARSRHELIEAIRHGRVQHNATDGRDWRYSPGRAGKVPVARARLEELVREGIVYRDPDNGVYHLHEQPAASGAGTP